MILTFAAVSVLAFVLFNLITVRGLGNGFCLLMPFLIIADLIARWHLMFHRYNPEASRRGALYLMACAGIAPVVVRLQRNRVA